MPSSARGAQTRDRVLRAALAVFERHGYADATMYLIADEAGVASGTLYQYFVDKADVFRCLLADLEVALYRETRMGLDEQGRLRAAPSILRYLELYREYRALYRVWWELLEPPSEFTDAWTALHESYTSDIGKTLTDAKKAGLVHDDLDVGIASEIIVALFERPTFTRVVLGWDDDVPDEDVARLADALIRGQGLGSQP
jgi:AcrR family transcriptional regulator